MTAGRGTGAGRAATWLPPAAAALGVAASLLAWDALVDGERAAARRAAVAELSTVSTVAREALAERLEGLRRTALRWERQGGRTRAEFELEAEVLRESYPSFRAVGWVGPDLTVRWVHPAGDNERALGLDVNREPRRAAAYARAAAGQVALTPPVPLVQGGVGIVAIAPVQAGRGDLGFTYAAIDPAVLLARDLAEVAAGQAVTVAGDGMPAVSVGMPTGAAALYSAFDLGGVRWEVSLEPAPPALALPHLVLALGLALSAMLGLALAGQARAAAAAGGLRASEARHRAVVETAVDAVIVIDGRGAVRSFNPAAERLFGYQAGEVVGRDVSMLMGPADAAAHAGHLARRAAAGGPRVTRLGRDLEGRRKDGSAVPLEASVGTWESGGERLHVGILRDVTQRRRAERELREGEARFRAVFEQAAVGFAIIRLDGTLERVNARLCAMLGYAEGELRGLDIWDITHPDDRGPDREWGRALARGEVGTYELRKRYLRKGGAVVWVHLTVAVERDAAGRALHFITAVADVSDQVRAEAAVREANLTLEERVADRTRELAELNAELEGFARTVAHDLRAPLRAMAGLSAALEEDYPEGAAVDATARDYLGRIADAATRMDRLIQDLLAYARLSREELAFAPVSLAQVVSDALLQLQAAVREAGAAVTVDGPLPEVLAHRAVLVQVVANLVGNGVKFVRPGRRPEVRVWAARPAPGRVRLWVGDNGVGIAPEHRERVFQVFERLHGMDEYPGTGIGLAIVRRGVERMGGEVGLEPDPGGGTRFWVELLEPASP